MHTTRHHRMHGTLATLRAMAPQRRLSVAEAMRLAKAQAQKLLRLARISKGPVPCRVVTEIPRIAVKYVDDLPTSGATSWNGHEWVIFLNRHESHARHRATMLHELKHIIDHPYQRLIYSRRAITGYAERELVANYFASCALMPESRIRAAWLWGLRQPHKIAERFNVTPRAAGNRLSELGLSTISQEEWLSLDTGEHADPDQSRPATCTCDLTGATA